MSAFDDITPPLDEEAFPPGSTKERPRAPVASKISPQALEPKAAALDWPELAQLEPPARRWAIKGWLGFGHVTLLVGAGGIGKTLLAQQLGSCLALGLPFIDEVANSHKCLMWACEDDHDELWRRQVALARWCKVGLESFASGLVIIPRHGLENALVGSEYGKLTFSPLIAELAEQAKDLKAEVVILDNAAQLYGAAENDRHSVTAFLNALAGALPGLAILLLAHPSRSSGSEFSGSSAWENVARTRLYLGATLPGEKADPEADPQDKVRYLARRKANYSPRDWRRMTYADGALTPDVVEEPSGIVASIKAERAERVVLAALSKLASMGLHGSDGTRATNFLPKLLSEYKLDEGVPSRELTAAMRSLMVEGKLQRTKMGFNSSRNPVMGLVATESASS